jgi:hypothetical protein
MDTEEVVKPAAQSAAAVEWRLSDRFVIRYEFASRQWSGQVQSYEDATGEWESRAILLRDGRRL